MLAALAAEPVAELKYEQGMKEVAAKDWDQALDLFEGALAADPDNLRYGSEYRQAAILRAQAIHGQEGKPEDFDRPIKFFEQLAARNPQSANLYLNYGLAYVDKVPVVDGLSRVSVANSALAQLTKSIELRPSWVAYYTRGTNYLFWPKFFDRTKLGIADLATATKMQAAGKPRPYYAHAWRALGDGFWKSNEPEMARAVWNEGLKEFPDEASLKERLSLRGEELNTLVREALDPKHRVDTNLKNLWLYP